MPTYLSLQEYMNTCCDCEGIMERVEGTIKEFAEDSEDDSPEIISWWECIDCGYKEKIK